MRENVLLDKQPMQKKQPRPDMQKDMEKNR